MNFKDLQKELPVLLGWRIHYLGKVYPRTSFVDLLNSEYREPIYLTYTSVGLYNLLLLVWGNNRDLILKRMNKVLELLLLEDGLLVDSVIPLYQEEISKGIELLQTEYNRRNKECMTN